MGIYDREYYRGDGPSFLGALSGRGQVCKWLIAINVICFLLEFMTTRQVPVFERFDGERVQVATRTASAVTDWFELDTVEVAHHGQLWRLLTYAFLHDPSSIWHILFNMLFLWWFGAELEELYGAREFLTFYLVAALAGGVVFELAWATGMSSAMECIGASGAVTALMVLYAMHFPRRIILFMFILPMPIWVFVTGMVLLDTFVLIGGAQTSTAVTVHLAGAAFGFLYYRSGTRLLNLVPDLRSWQRHWSRPRLKVYRGEHTQRPITVSPPPPRSDLDEQLEAKLDAVLEKVARQGQDSLNDEERQILQRASEAFKRRHT